MVSFLGSKIGAENSCATTCMTSSSCYPPRSDQLIYSINDQRGNGLHNYYHILEKDVVWCLDKSHCTFCLLLSLFVACLILPDDSAVLWLDRRSAVDCAPKHCPLKLLLSDGPLDADWRLPNLWYLKQDTSTGVELVKMLSIEPAPQRQLPNTSLEDCRGENCSTPLFLLSS